MNSLLKLIVVVFGLLIALNLSAQEDKYTEKLRAYLDSKQYQEIIDFKKKKEGDMAAKSLYYKAMAYYMTDNDRKALTYFDKAIELGPVDVDMYYHKASTLYYLKKYEDAIIFFDKAIEMIPSEPDFYMGKGYAVYMLEDFEEAKSIFLKAKTFDDCSDRVYAVLGNVCFDLKQYDEAIEYYKKAISLAEIKSDSHQGLNFNLSLVYQQAKMFEDAKQTLIGHLKIYPNDFAAHSKLIQANYALETISEANDSKAALLKAHYANSLPKYMRDMYCIDQFSWQDQNVLSYVTYEKSDYEIYVWKHKFIFEDGENDDLKILAVLDSSAQRDGKPDQYKLIKIENDTVYSYNHLVVNDQTDYLTLKKAVITILDGDVQPIEKVGGYSTWYKAQRALRRGNEGSSFETAIVVESISAEYAWIRENYPGAKVNQQSLLSNDGKMYDLLRFETAEGETLEIYFDINSFFGKW